MDHLGRFPVTEELGRGAMGVVYRGFHPGLEVPVAIKVLSDNYSKDPQFRHRFQREAAAIAALNHPGIVRVYDFDTDQDSLFIVMEFVDGNSVRAMLQERGRLSVSQSLDIVQQLLSAVGAAHAHNIVHRDLKPDNIALSSLGKVKVMDFGISKLLVDTGGLTGTDSIIGTPTYMSPEQVRGEAVDGRSDIYSIGAILYELMNGTPPFTGQLAAVLHAQIYSDAPDSETIPAPVMAMIRKAMAKDPRKRFASCEEFAGALLQLDTATLTNPGGAPAAPERPARNLQFKIPGLARRAAPPPNSPLGTQVRTACTEAECAHHTEWMCSYQDPTGYACGTWWCAKHVARLGNDAFCRRHANVIKALAVNAGTIREIKHLPAVTDRAITLAALVGGDIDKEITEILRRRYSSRQDVTVVADRAVRENRSAAAVAWERNWSAARNQGYETRITLAVSTDEPSEVKLRVGSMEIFSGVPDWIANRLQGKPPNHSDRAHFRARLIQCVTEAVDRPAPLAGGFHPAADTIAGPPPAQPLPDIDSRILEGLVLRAFVSSTTNLPGYEVAKMLALPFASIEMLLRKLAADRLLEAGGISAAGADRPMQERMAYTMTNQGRELAEEISKTGTHYFGPAPVTLADYNRATTEVILPGLDQELVRRSLEGLELAPGIEDAVRAAVNSRGSMFIYGSPGNGKTSLARRIPRLLRGPILVPHAIDLGSGEVMAVYDPAVHKLDTDQPHDGRWQRVIRPLVQVGGEFTLDMLTATWDPAGRFYQAPLQLKANGGVLLIDDFGRQQVTPKQILDRLMVPLEQAVDHLQLAGSGRKVEIPFRTMLIFSTNLTPGELLDEAYLRRLAYKVRMPDPTPQVYQRIFEKERQRLGIPPNPAVFPQIGQLYGSMSIRGNHPRDLLERLVDVASARGMKPELSPELVDAAWRTLFVAT
ncbi:MAG TPA: protein kinase [Candidatus Dormibacteraeota bacterium]|nr:protein kinase [Candidatus Dormibacteraeota bacterium]